MFTFLPEVTRAKLAEATRLEPHKREAQVALADTMTAMVHGSRITDSIKRSATVLYSGADVRSLYEVDLKTLLTAVPVVQVSKAAMPKLARVLVDAGLEPSMTQATKTIQGGGVSVNGIRQLATEPELLSTEEPLCGSFYLVKKGKRSFVIIEATV